MNRLRPPGGADLRCSRLNLTRLYHGIGHDCSAKGSNKSIAARSAGVLSSLKNYSLIAYLQRNGSPKKYQLIGSPKQY